MFEIHPSIQSAIDMTVAFLDTYAPGYTKLIENKQWEEMLKGEEAIHLAAQFKWWTTGHIYKVQDTFNSLDIETFRNENNIVVIDIGCGGGAGSIAIIDYMLKQENNNVRQPRQIHLIGVDPNRHALVIYNQVINNISACISGSNLQIKHHVVAKGMPEVVPYITKYLSRLRTNLDKPRLPHITITQVNVSRPLNDMYNRYVENDVKWLLKNGVSSEAMGNETFGQIEAQSYEQLIMLSKADKALILTIGTHHDNPKFNQYTNVQQMGTALVKILSDKNKGHHVTPIDVLTQKKPIQYPPSPKQYYYYAHVLDVKHKEYAADKDWEQITSADNLKMAWVRVRASQLRESFVDELELRLFESQLEENLNGIRSLLSNYNFVEYARFYYNFPKKPDEARPRTLLRLTEEIMLAAVIQVLGRRASALMTNVFAYRLSSENSEYFYRPWFKGYKHFVRSVKNYASKLGDNVVIVQLDIKNFYPTINQNLLYELAGQELRALRSDRVMWLLKKLLIRDMEYGSAGEYLGIPQGGIVSGFLANLYLIKIHEIFNDTYSKARLFRYVDDMIIVIHDKADESDVIRDLNTICIELGVSIPLSEGDDKFFRWESVSQFGEDVELSDALGKLGWKFQQCMAHLFFMDDEYRQVCSQNWWDFIHFYQTCLKSLGVFIKPDRLSRKLNQYVQNPRLRDRFNGEWMFAAPLNMPLMMATSAEWKHYFQSNNSNWTSKFQKIKTEISELLVKTRNEYLKLLQEEDGNSEKSQKRIRLNRIQQKKALGTIRFCIGRLARIGYDYASVDEVILDLFCQMPQIIRNPHLVFEHLALQDRLDMLVRLLKCFEASDIPGADYLRAMLLKSLRYLVSASHFNGVRDVLRNYALHPDSTSAERLMALETIAALSLCDTHLAEELVDVIDGLTEARLIAATILIIGDVSPHLLQSIDQTILTDDYVCLAYNTALKQSTKVVDLFTPTEAEVLRMYYASAYPDGSDEFEEGTSP